MPPSSVYTVSHDQRAVLINGRRELLICGEIHYARVPDQEWARVLDATKAAGVNCIASYVFWNWHEPRRGCFDFSGQHDIAHFLSLCKERGLHVLLRAGPYCCAEWNYGGFPAWLRDEPGIEFRTFNQPFLERTENYMRHLFTEITPHLATRGGAIILVQLENEYANIAKRYQEDGDRYLAWMLELGRRCGIDVPVVMCEGGAPGSIEALNGFSISEARINDFLRRCPQQPLIWTELWTGWYDTWGYERHVRDTGNLCYHLLRFIAAGGTAWNYYMWHGGTQLGRTSMYLQATAYDFGGPLDESGRLTPKGHHLGLLHALLLSQKELLLNGQIQIGPNQTIWKKGRRKLVLDWNPTGYDASLSDETGRVLFASKPSAKSAFKTPPWRPLTSLDFQPYQTEQMPAERGDEPVRAQSPVEQLLLTKDESDYCWYSHILKRTKSGMHELHLPRCGDFLRVFVNGKSVAQTPLPIRECRGATMPPLGDATPSVSEINVLETTLSHYGFTCRIPLSAGSNRIDILCGALGLIKGDWMISGPMGTERKGIWGEVYLDGAVLHGWEMRARLIGETRHRFSTPAHKSVRRDKNLGWWRASFDLAPRLLTDRHDFRVDLAGWDKGLLYLNGRLLSRYWLIEGHGYGGDESWHEAKENGMSLTGKGTPTQRFYRLPTSWLETHNTIELFDEGSPAMPARAGVVYRVHSTTSTPGAVTAR